MLGLDNIQRSPPTSTTLLFDYIEPFLKVNETASTTPVPEVSAVAGTRELSCYWNDKALTDKDIQALCLKTCLQGFFLDYVEMRCSVADPVLHKISD